MTENFFLSSANPQKQIRTEKIYLSLIVTKYYDNM
jgi:hypothetical protein